jgi:hypothetical protein
MLNKALIAVSLAGVSLTLGACTTLPVTTDVNPHYSVANCHSYAFAHEHVANVDQPAAFGNPLNADRLRLAIEANMKARGIGLTEDRAAADCTVGYAMGTRQVVSDFYGGWGYGWGYGWGPGWGGPWAGGPWVEDETRIAVDIFDTKSRTAIWHAAVSQTVSGMTGPNATAKINAAVAAIFGKFPAAAMPPTAPAPTGPSPAAT